MYSNFAGCGWSGIGRGGTSVGIGVCGVQKNLDQPRWLLY